MEGLFVRLNSHLGSKRIPLWHGFSPKLLARGRSACLVVLIGLMLACSLSAEAQWVSQTLTLKPGWNAVYLEIEPQPGDCEVVFEGIPIESVWYWSPNTSPVQFITNPNKLEPKDPDWRVYFPPTALASTLTTLRVMRGNRAYLIKLGGTEEVPLTLRGIPSLRTVKWIPDSYNLVGFPVDAANIPTFANLFASSSAHAGKAVMRFNAEGQWEQVANLATAKLAPGEAFWVYTEGVSEYQGPLRGNLDVTTALDFGKKLTEVSFRITNDSAAAKTYSLTQKASEEPADTASPALAGPVPLTYWKDDYASQDVGWRALTGSLGVTIPAGKLQLVKLAVQRNQMVPPARKADAVPLYQSILEISDGQGTLTRIPVTAQGPDAGGAKGGSHPLAGLWIGSTTLKAVSTPAGQNPTTPEPTGSEFSFQIIVHVDGTGKPRFLQHVTQMWKRPTYAPDPANPQNQILQTPGRYVLITDDSQLGKFQGAGERGGTAVGRRFSSPAFGFQTPIEMAGAFPTPTQPAGTITCLTTLDYNDPLNPFKHKYHPDHDNMNERRETVLPEGTESFTIKREIALEFADYSVPSPENDLLLSAYAGWGDSWIGGTYKETISGIHRDPLYVEGTFQLNFVSDATELNPEN